MDKGYDYPEVYELLKDYGYTIHVRLRGDGGRRRSSSRKIPKYRARHWVVERTHSWMNRFRRLLIRWEKKIENYIAMLHFACAWITHREAAGNNNNEMVIHIHPHLSLVVDGKPVTVPGQIGIASSLWKDHSLDKYGMQAMSDGMQGMAPLHTHDDSGTIHVESNANRNYTLGEFLSIWGGLDLNGRTVKATVDGGKPVSDYSNIILKDGEQISLEIT